MRAGVRVLYNALVEITAYRFNTFIKPVLSLVEDLDLPDMTIEQRMKPVIRYEGLVGVMSMLGCWRPCVLELDRRLGDLKAV